MDILFRKLPGHRHEILVKDRRGPEVRLPPQPTGPTIPHALALPALDDAAARWAAVPEGDVLPWRW